MRDRSLPESVILNHNERREHQIWCTKFLINEVISIKAPQRATRASTTVETKEDRKHKKYIFTLHSKCKLIANFSFFVMFVFIQLQKIILDLFPIVTNLSLSLSSSTELNSHKMILFFSLFSLVLINELKNMKCFTRIEFSFEMENIENVTCHASRRFH